MEEEFFCSIWCSQESLRAYITSCVDCSVCFYTWQAPKAQECTSLNKNYLYSVSNRYIWLGSNEKTHTCGWLCSSDVCGFLLTGRKSFLKPFYFKSSNRFQTMWAKTCSQLHPCTPTDCHVSVQACFQREQDLLSFFWSIF